MDYLNLLNSIDSFVWGPPLLVLLVGTGIMLTIKLKFLQIFSLPKAFKLIFTSLKDQGNHDGDINSFHALCTALAATIGTGNIVGVATAIKVGGPGSLFWMWVAAFFGMATKYSECLLAVKFRSIDAKGAVAGGPMHYIELGLGKKYKPLAIMFAVSGVLVAYFGIGTFAQVNAITEITNLSFGIPVKVVAAVLTILVTAVTIGGLKSISKVASKIVPTMALIYFIAVIGFLVIFADKVPGALKEIITCAFNPTAAKGGFLGSTIIIAMRSGIARGVFSNESGLGSAPIVAAAAKVKWPAQQGLISMTGTFIDTIIVCTLTGLTLIISGLWTGDLNGAALTQAAFSTGYPVIGKYILTIGLVLFAFTTILGWNYYGERCMEYLVGVRGILPYRVVFIVLIACGAFIKLEAIWTLADIVNGLMAIPNLIALIGLSGVVVAETKSYKKHLQEIENK
ncbi:alanine/glycine:cation symporter family protein [Fusobacterium sp. MFO224]|uniref:alanine/glycine:cation symporter family protein n=1 Tax=Fusobacterium sp. MFO224 TaxID=3378070 RepID=UPI003851DF82